MNQPLQDSITTDQSGHPIPLSVIVASATGARDLELCLAKLYGQCASANAEIIVADCCPGDSAAEVIARYPDVTFIRFAAKTPLPALWGAALKRSAGAVVAVIESVCLVADDWVQAVLRAHQSAHPVIGGSVENGAGGSLVDWAAFFCEYGQFMQPLAAGVASELPGNNISFKRWTLDHAAQFVENGFWKTYWCRELQREGILLFADPAIVIHLSKSYQLLPFLVRRFHHGRCFAGMRLPASAVARRAVYAIGSVVLPALFLARIIRSNVSKGNHLSEFVVSLPITVLAIAGWCCGEFWGYLVGSGDSCAHIN